MDSLKSYWDRFIILCVCFCVKCFYLFPGIWFWASFWCLKERKRRKRRKKRRGEENKGEERKREERRNIKKMEQQVWKWSDDLLEMKVKISSFFFFFLYSFFSFFFFLFFFFFFFLLYSFLFLFLSLFLSLSLLFLIHIHIHIHNPFPSLPSLLSLSFPFLPYRCFSWSFLWTKHILYGLEHKRGL